jgi:stage III sporulation protein AG
MKTKNFGETAKRLLKNKYMLCVLLLGLVLILLPTGNSGDKKSEGEVDIPALSAPAFSLESEERRLSETLQQIDGAGKVQVLLSLSSTASRELAETEGEPLVVSAGSGVQAPVELWYDYPEYLGAVVLCAGADNPRVKLDITNAVVSFTGLGSDKITVIKMK